VPPRASFEGLVALFVALEGHRAGGRCATALRGSLLTMRIIPSGAVALVPLVLANCTEMPRTNYHWVNAGGDMSTMNADWLACVAANSYGSRIADTNTDGGQILHADGVEPDKVVACMKGRGWMLNGTVPG
jgi:hypothetical protein